MFAAITILSWAIFSHFCSSSLRVSWAVICETIFCMLQAVGDAGTVECQGGSPDLDVLELVCVWAWGVAGSPETFNLKKGLTKVLDLIARPKDIIIYWTNNYDPNVYLPHVECTT